MSEPGRQENGDIEPRMAWIEMDDTDYDSFQLKPKTWDCLNLDCLDFVRAGQDDGN